MPFDGVAFKEMKELVPHAQQAIIDRHFPGGVPFWTEIYDEDPDLDLNIGSDDSHTDLWVC